MNNYKLKLLFLGLLIGFGVIFNAPKVFADTQSSYDSYCINNNSDTNCSGLVINITDSNNPPSWIPTTGLLNNFSVYLQNPNDDFNGISGITFYTTCGYEAYSDYSYNLIPVDNQFHLATFDISGLNINLDSCKLTSIWLRVGGSFNLASAVITQTGYTTQTVNFNTSERTPAIAINASFPGNNNESADAVRFNSNLFSNQLSFNTDFKNWPVCFDLSTSTIDSQSLLNVSLKVEYGPLLGNHSQYIDSIISSTTPDGITVSNADRNIVNSCWNIPKSNQLGLISGTTLYATAFLIDDNDNSIIASSTSRTFIINNTTFKTELPLTNGSSTDSSADYFNCDSNSISVLSWNIGKDVCKLVEFLITPSSNIGNMYSNLLTRWKNMPPFSFYFSQAESLQSIANSTATSTSYGFSYTASSSPVGTMNINLKDTLTDMIGIGNYNLIYQLIASGIWFTVGVYLFFRTKNLL